MSLTRAIGVVSFWLALSATSALAADVESLVSRAAPIAQNPSDALRKHGVDAVSKLKEESGHDYDAPTVQAFSWDFLNREHAVFVAAKTTRPHFVHDRGYVDESLFVRGLWSEKAAAEVKAKDYGKAFARFDLTQQEAISFWQVMAGRSTYVTEPAEGMFGNPGASPPTWKDGVLTIAVYAYTGMRGPVFERYVVKFPRSRRDGFSLRRL